MSNTKTEAQRLADALQRDMDMNWPDFDNGEAIVDELRRLDAENQQLRAQLDQAVAEEREACANVCDRIDLEYEGEDVQATWCAAAIRARSNT